MRITTEGKFYLDRNFQISVATQPSTNVSIRIYILQSEFDSLKAADPSIQNRMDLWMMKTAQPCGSILGSGLSVQPISNSDAANGFYVEYSIPGFSSFYFRNSSSALPVKLKSFTTEKLGIANKICWITETGFNSAGFEVEKSY